MKPWLSYTFEHATNELPEYASRMPVYEPCFSAWNPSIFCEDLSQTQGAFYNDQPFPRANIKEIHVESVRAYHLLKRHTFVDDWEGLVRILPPEPESGAATTKFMNTIAFAFDDDEMIISAKTTARLGGCSCMMPCQMTEAALNASKVAIFPNKKSSTSLFLCAAIGAGCRVVSSDAGSAEEYLSKYAAPGTWHVVHRHSQSVYEQAAAHLLGMNSNIDRTMYVDEVPYE